MVRFRLFLILEKGERHNHCGKRKRGHKKAGGDLRKAKNVEEKEWQRNHDEILCDKRTNGSGYAKGIEANPEQIDLVECEEDNLWICAKAEGNVFSDTGADI